MKTKKKKVILVTIMTILIISVCLIGGQTYAKYFTEIKGKGVAKVAKWSFLVNGESDTIQNIQLVNTYDKDLLEAGTIAPGTTGSFEILIDATGADTAVIFNVEFLNEKNKPKNIVYEVGGRRMKDLKDIENWVQGIITEGQSEKRVRYTVKWTWDYETGTTSQEITQNDEQDTLDAQNLEDYSFDIVIKAHQAEPRKI